MNCVLFAKMDQVFSKENQTLKKYWKIGEKYWKSQGKSQGILSVRKSGNPARSSRKTRSQDLNKSKSLGFPLTIEKGGNGSNFEKASFSVSHYRTQITKKLSQQSATTDCYTTKFGARYCFYTCLSFCSRGGGGFPVCITGA